MINLKMIISDKTVKSGKYFLSLNLPSICQKIRNCLSDNCPYFNTKKMVCSINWIEKRLCTCGLTVIKKQFLNNKKTVLATYIDCIPFCTHYIYDGDAIFCELNNNKHISGFTECNLKINTKFNVNSLCINTY
jgi:hypothetical protein